MKKKSKYIKEARVNVNEFPVNTKKSSKKTDSDDSSERKEIKGFQQSPKETDPDKKNSNPLANKTNKRK